MQKSKKIKISVAVLIVIILIITATLLYFKFRNNNTESTNNTVGENVISEEKITFKNITDDEAKAELDKDNTIIVLDVRSEEEYQQSHIPNSILIPVNELESKAVSQLPDKQSKIFVYCRSGARSTVACGILVNLGYTNVYNLGGIINWPYETVSD